MIWGSGSVLAADFRTTLDLATPATASNIDLLIFDVLSNLTSSKLYNPFWYSYQPQTIISQ